MILIEKNKNLQSIHTFNVSVRAAYYVSIKSIEQLQTLATKEVWSLPKLIIGGGSNLLFIKDFGGLVIHMQNKGIEITNENESTALVKAQAGEEWHAFVMHMLNKNLYGLENLSLIPGCVGASPMQNIGAYGVEVEQVFEELTAFHIATGELHTFTHNDCNFGYRTSVFKTTLKDQYIIIDVTFRLYKTPTINSTYGAIQDVLKAQNIEHASPKDVSNAVISIRKSKLPDPAEIGNAGSFFKNPVVNKDLFLLIHADYPTMPFYLLDNETYKIPAGWLIEQCGWKGKKRKHIGCFEKQALILVNYGGGQGKEIWEFAQDIQESVANTFQILLEPEVNIIL